MNADISNPKVVAVPPGVGSAVGMSKSHWYVAFVKNNTEKSVLDKLGKSGYDCYVPLQKELRIWKNGKRAVVERVVIPTIVFINCTESERKEILNYPYIIRFMSDRASLSASGVGKPLATIPDAQMKNLMFMVGNSDTPVTFSDSHYKKGDMVRVIRGRLAGLEGMVNNVDDKHSEIIVNLDYLGNARLTIETINVERIKQ